LFLALIISPFVVAALIVAYGLTRRSSLAPTERPGWGWIVALVLCLLADAVLVLAFVLAVAVYNCHGGYECPF
jgi:hypothetical protein